MLFPLNECKNACAIGAEGHPEEMQTFCNAHAPPGSRNFDRCRRAVLYAGQGDYGSCQGECNAMHHNWAK